jgi:hypothetical protein
MKISLIIASSAIAVAQLFLNVPLKLPQSMYENFITHRKKIYNFDNKIKTLRFNFLKKYFYHFIIKNL